MSIPTQQRPSGPVGAVSLLDRAAVEAFSTAVGEPEWVRECRLEAWEQYQQLPTPTLSTEGWRRTDIRGLELDALARPSTTRAGTNSAPAALIAVSGVAGEHAGQLVLMDGEVARRELDASLAARGVVVTSLREALQTHPEIVRHHLFETVRSERNRFTALNGALWNDGAFV
ncbi:MAG: hypothetical protein IT307_00810, partial [Chloroflexi bacterium]|nr:hypothetical protein [Chloroflexota bacterium]